MEAFRIHNILRLLKRVKGEAKQTIKMIPVTTIKHFLPTQLVSAHSPRDVGYSPTMRPKDEIHVSGEGNPHRRTSRGINGSNYTINHSSLHPCKMDNGGYSSSDGSSAGNQALTSKSPGRFRMHGVEDDKIINKGSAFPKFGEWDESNPSSADGFTGIFNKVREGNQLSSATVPNVSSAETYANYHGSTDESLNNEQM
ncbi:hypothetical protein ZIOFF_018948 [Zingiber officinale]|uniref:RIN4 pathogenic type III effector avirulence factor Avr cleavage site domain-containing protein n=1 Tax=Zingiber officinale TaxID=94328 RepID=A0A8J5HDL4_ZINOF|nr:hypothetical protein ZIOFF_018948 [Zingiber officinale]